MLKNAQTYEIMRPEDVGLARGSLVLGKHSGRHAFRERVRQLGFELDETELNRVFEEFKALADRKKELFDGDIEALVLRAEHDAAGPWALAALESASRTGAPSSASVTLTHTDGRRLTFAATGDGPVDAAYKAVETATGLLLRVRKFEVRAVTVGEDAQGETVVYVDYNNRSYRGASVSTNIVEGSVNALLEVINRIELAQRSARSAGSGERRDSEVLAKTAV
jgi:2-isopropylmalate synthase